MPYLLKLLCLCLASFFLVHLALSIAIWLATPAAIRIAARIRPVLGARLLLFLRMLPAGLGGFTVAALCVPSYLWLEPKTVSGEGIGLVCLALSVLTLTLGGFSITRAGLALARSLRYLRHCQRTGLKTELAGESLPAWIVDQPGALFVIAGVFRPRLLVSRQVTQVLSGEQLSAAVRHERAHWTSHDNLKRLMLALAPGMLPFFYGFARLERGWAIYTERAADDQAVGGDARRSLSLAAALVGVSRLGAVPKAPVLAVPLLADDDLPGRVERLLNTPPRTEANASWMGCLVAAAAVMLSGAVIALGLQPEVLHPIHRVLEHLIG